MACSPSYPRGEGVRRHPLPRPQIRSRRGFPLSNAMAPVFLQIPDPNRAGTSKQGLTFMPLSQPSTWGLAPHYFLLVAQKHARFDRGGVGCQVISAAAQLLFRRGLGVLCNFLTHFHIFLHLMCTKSVAGDRGVPSLESRWMWRYPGEEKRERRKSC